ncbi:MAG: 3-phosphoshikimate 1-carboxyvinyltransferase [Nitrososphaerales archaeon]|nr:3-phosphoshikimate 1-carboxyvinyltransferase [Nitrososphaerales archaeon]
MKVPPSKSYTHRGVLLASLAEGSSRILKPLISRDTRATIQACSAMGAVVAETDSAIEVRGGRPSTPDDVIDAENSGTTLRLMTSVLSLAPEGYSIITGDRSVRKRPMQPLLDALGQLGVEAWSARPNGCAPVIVRGGGMKGGECAIRGDVSSQFVSSLLISSPLADSDTVVKVDRAVSKPYIDATLYTAEKFGIEVGREGYSSFAVPSGQEYSPCEFEVPGDFSSASFIVAAAALAGGRVELKGLDASVPQGDSFILEVARKMGVKVIVQGGGVIVESDGKPLTGGSFSLSDFPDLLPVLSVLALKCGEEVELTGVPHARYKETDRIAVLAEELAKVGAKVEEREDGLKIQPVQELRPAALDAHDDHRMFMAFALVSMLRPSGITVTGVESLDVSYPSFLQDITRLGASVRSGSG